MLAEQMEEERPRQEATENRKELQAQVMRNQMTRQHRMAEAEEPYQEGKPEERLQGLREEAASQSGT
eukprot:CAMPEP_0196654558 /NCGR_PEP_ID=MMETSP1086-20130531/4285_1 /TAXON_ID=77921 /ORGANISM="Cyanoptyche  gloeocystis , Strain SAG4.97" /LENGTH=66 /DNA_ID=CAMNT_0041986397 /DNA_START=370 /DNA_END=570 /DNA_ORIENTATION=+